MGGSDELSEVPYLDILCWGEGGGRWVSSEFEMQSARTGHGVGVVGREEGRGEEKRKLSGMMVFCGYANGQHLK